MASPPLDFIFEPETGVDRASLLQGDLLQRTSDLAKALAPAHRYYAEAEDYSHFLVLTQSCDLVRRGGGSCRSRYITICAVRPLSVAFGRELDRHVKPLPSFPLPVASLESKILARQFLERVLNNTVDGMFFIPKDTAPSVDRHMCAFLALSIAVRTDMYDACLAAKVAQATPIFAAKIGHLTSGLYGRVATPDLAEVHGPRRAAQFQKEFFEELGLRDVVWLSSHQRVQLDRAIAGRAAMPSQDEATTMLDALPTEASSLATKAIEVLVRKSIVADDADVTRRAANFIANDPGFARMVRGA